MCLTVKQNLRNVLLPSIFKDQKALVAKKDIICYKHYYQSVTNPDCLISEYQRAKVILRTDGDTHLGEELHFKKSMPYFPSSYGKFIPSFYVTHGYHSYADTESSIQQYTNTELVIYKCIIPKGSLYYKGNVNSNPDCKGYCSNNLIIIGKHTS